MTVLYGVSIVEGYAEGEAIVAESLCFLGGVDPKSGIINEGPLKGMSVNEKILILYNTHGSSAQFYHAYAMIKTYKKGPKGIITCAKDATIGSIAIETETPLVRLDKEKIKEIKSGDYIKMTAEKNTIEKTNDHFTSRPSKGTVEIIK